MILIFNLKRKRLYRVFLVPSFMAEARGLGFCFAKSFRSSSLGKNWIRLQGGVRKSACIFETTTQKIENPHF